MSSIRLCSMMSNKAWAKSFTLVLPLEYRRSRWAAVFRQNLSGHDRCVSTVQHGFIVLIAETVGKIVHQAVDEYYLRDIDEASTRTAGDKTWIARLSRRATRPSKISFNFELYKVHRCCRRCRRSSFCRGLRKNQYQKDVTRYLTPSLTSLPSLGTTAVVIRSTRSTTGVTIHWNLP